MVFGADNDGTKGPEDFGVSGECIQNCQSEAVEACESGNIAIHAQHVCVYFLSSV